MIVLKKNIQKQKEYANWKRTTNNEETFVCLVFVGVPCFSRPLNVFGIVDVPEGKEHLIPENFSTIRKDRRWTFNRDRSKFELVNLSWWEFDVLTNEFERSCRLVICNDDVRRTVVVRCEDLSGVINCSDRLTIVDRLLKKWKGLYLTNNLIDLFTWRYHQDHLD